MSKTLCPHCDARLAPAEARDGWCETCGKKLPSAAVPRRDSRDAREAKPAVNSWTRVGQILGGVIFAFLMTGPLRSAGYLPTFLAGFAVMSVCAGIGYLIDCATAPSPAR
ncbi:MAG: hypothetical protein K2W96_05545 [Gemmataceae bacterium]|nr:hypothetical protein [Gemmataceae bacterium]